MLEMQWKLEPMKVGAHYENVMIYEVSSHTWWPLAFVHIDTFHSKDQTDLHDKLTAGETVCVTVKMSPSTFVNLPE